MFSFQPGDDLSKAFNNVVNLPTLREVDAPVDLDNLLDDISALLFEEYYPNLAKPLIEELIDLTGFENAERYLSEEGIDINDFIPGAEG